jgi:hypothetical protein
MYSLVKKLSFLIDDRRSLSDIVDWFFISKEHTLKIEVLKSSTASLLSAYLHILLYKFLIDRFKHNLLIRKSNHVLSNAGLMMVRVYYYAEKLSIHRFQAERKMIKNSIILPKTILLGEKNEKPTGASKSIFFFEFRSLILYQPICNQYYSKYWKSGDENIWENSQKGRGFKDIHIDIIKIISYI